MEIKSMFALTDSRNRHTTFAHIVGGVAIGLVAQFIRFVALLELTAAPLVVELYGIISISMFCHYFWYKHKKNSKLHSVAKAFLLVAIAALTGILYMSALNFIFKVW
jgi:hypothetical protein